MIWLVFLNFGIFVGAIAFNMWSNRKLQKRLLFMLNNYRAFIELVEKKNPELLCEFRNTLNDEANAEITETMEK